MAEYSLYPELMLEATRLGNRLFQNNRGVGKYTRRDGSEGFVAFGLFDGASDLIGWSMRNGVAVFTAVEVKRPGAVRSATKKKRLEAQERFIAAVKAAGGIAGFVTSTADYRALVGAE